MGIVSLPNNSIQFIQPVHFIHFAKALCLNIELLYF